LKEKLKEIPGRPLVVLTSLGITVKDC
jgi:hypothetical protein